MAKADLHLGDCLDVMRALPDGCASAVVTDPPYGTHVEGDGYGRRQKWGGAQVIANDGDLSALDSALPELRRVLRKDGWLVFFHSPKRREEVSDVCRRHGLRVLGEAVWDKKAPGLGGGIRYQHETVLLCSFGAARGRCGMPSVLREWVPKGQHGHRQQHHTHEKPVGVTAHLVRYTTREGETVLDPFAGSGTTGVACVETGRNFIGVEISSEYYAVAERRIAAAQPCLSAQEAV